MIRWFRRGPARTVLLAITATGTFVAAAILTFDVDPRLMLQLFLVCLLGLAFIIGCAALFVLVRRWLRHLFSR